MNEMVIVNILVIINWKVKLHWRRYFVDGRVCIMFVLITQSVCGHFYLC